MRCSSLLFGRNFVSKSREGDVKGELNREYILFICARKFATFSFSNFSWGLHQIYLPIFSCLVEEHIEREDHTAERPAERILLFGWYTRIRAVTVLLMTIAHTSQHDDSPPATGEAYPDLANSVRDLRKNHINLLVKVRLISGWTSQKTHQSPSRIALPERPTPADLVHLHYW